MSPWIIVLCLTGYFGLILLISWLTGKASGDKDFFLGGRQSPWYVVAFGMIGASLSGVTFISIPGWVGSSSFSYYQLVLGYLPGYLFIALVLMPLYYRLNLTSIYSYLETRFGSYAYKTGAAFFLLSRTIGASFRLFLVAGVLHLALFSHWGLPFGGTVIATILLIWLYTFRGGIRTIVWTDSLQTFFLLLALALSIYYMMSDLSWDISTTVAEIRSSGFSQVFFWEAGSPQNFWKQFLSGAFMAIVMTGLDQDMMQKNLSCKNIGEAQKNMFWFSILLAIVNLVFLALGAMLFLYAAHFQIEIPQRSDDLFPMLALQYFPPVAGIVFVIGLTAAAYSSADSALTALTTSFCVDFLGFEKGSFSDPEKRRKIRYMTHLGFSLLMLGVILLFRAINDDAVIKTLFTVAGYTYGPLLGLFFFGLFTKRKVRDRWTPLVCLLSPVICFFLSKNSEQWWGFRFGFELLLVNGGLTFAGLLALSFGLKEKE